MASMISTAENTTASAAAAPLAWRPPHVLRLARRRRLHSKVAHPNRGALHRRRLGSLQRLRVSTTLNPECVDAAAGGHSVLVMFSRGYRIAGGIGEARTAIVR